MIPDVVNEMETGEGPGAKERIFHAAMSIAVRKGFGKVALSQVAREAGLSKGGLLYHFTTKNDLIAAMLEFYAAPAAPYARSLQPGEAGSPISDLDPFAVAVLIAAAENPALLEPFGEILQSVAPGTGRSTARRSLSLAASLANRLGFDTTAPNNRWKDLGADRNPAF